MTGIHCRNSEHGHFYRDRERERDRVTEEALLVVYFGVIKGRVGKSLFLIQMKIVETQPTVVQITLNVGASERASERSSC